MEFDNSCRNAFQQILRANERISGMIHKTPVQTCTTINEKVERNVYFKCENFQKTGAFKARGALNAVLAFKEINSNCAGVVTHSSGNHAQALAWAAKIAGVPCTVVVPNNAPKTKLDAITGYGAKVVFCEPNPQSRESTCHKIQEESDFKFIPSSDHEDVISGQGTMGLEFLQQVPELDAILASVSGGGMVSGIALAVKEIKPSIKIYAVEPVGKELEKSLRAQRRLWPNPPRYLDTIGDGIRCQQAGYLNFKYMCRLLEKEVFTVTDQQMIDAMKFTWERLKLVIEPSAAASVAAVFSNQMQRLDPAVKNIGIILCGGNVDLENIPWVKNQ